MPDARPMPNGRPDKRRSECARRRSFYSRRVLTQPPPIVDVSRSHATAARWPQGAPAFGISMNLCWSRCWRHLAANPQPQCNLGGSASVDPPRKRRYIPSRRHMHWEPRGAVHAHASVRSNPNHHLHRTTGRRASGHVRSTTSRLRSANACAWDTWWFASSIRRTGAWHGRVSPYPMQRNGPPLLEGSDRPASKRQTWAGGLRQAASAPYSPNLP